MELHKKWKVSGYHASMRFRVLDRCVKALDFEDLAKICCLPGAHEDVMALIKTPVLHLSDKSLTLAEKFQYMVNIIQTVVDKLSYFSTLEQFVWLIRTTISVQLAKVGSSRLIRLLMQVYAAIRTMNRKTFKHTPEVIEVVAKSFRDVIAMINNNPISTLFRLRLAYDQLYYHTAVAILFVRIDELVHPNNKTVQYRVRGLGDILIYLLNFDVLQATQKSAIVHEFLLMLHAYQLLVLGLHVKKSAHDLQEEYGPFAEHYFMKHEYVVLFRQWFDTVVTIVNGLNNANVTELLNRHIVPLAEGAKLASYAVQIG